MTDDLDHWSEWSPEQREQHAAQTRERHGDVANTPRNLRWCWLTPDGREELAAGHRAVADIWASDDEALKALVSALLREESVLPCEGLTDSAWQRAQLDALRAASDDDEG